jgi:predicted O-methyltransferase YrrM
MHEMAQWKEPWQFTEAFPAPAHAVEHAIGTDVQEDVPILYALVKGVRPRLIVELGTRQGTTARTLAAAAREVGALFYTIDPDPGCKPFLESFLDDPRHCMFINMTGELAYEQKVTPKPDLLFLDTDPHTKDQTRGWLETWVEQYLADGAVVAFHDTVAARPEIQVADAVREWLPSHPGWVWTELHTTYGLGLLWKP